MVCLAIVSNAEKRRQSSSTPIYFNDDLRPKTGGVGTNNNLLGFKYFVAYNYRTSMTEESCVFVIPCTRLHHDYIIKPARRRCNAIVFFLFFTTATTVAGLFVLYLQYGENRIR